MPIGKELGRGSGHIVLGSDPVGTNAPTAAPPHFLAHVYCDQTVAHLSCWALVKHSVFICNYSNFIQSL